MDKKSAYIAGGATIVAAFVGIVGNSMFNRNSEPSVSLDGDGNNVNVVQGSENVTINQSVNELGKLRRYEADSMQQSLVSGCATMLDYFENRKHFNVDSIDTLVGLVWVQKDKYTSFFGAESQRQAMEIVEKINPLYIAWMPGVYALNNPSVIGAQLPDMPGVDKDEALDNATKMMLKDSDRTQPALVAETKALCEHFRGLKFVGG